MPLGPSPRTGSSLVSGAHSERTDTLKKKGAPNQKNPEHQVTPYRDGQLREPLGVRNATLPLKSKGITRAQHLSKDAQSLIGSSAG